MSVFIYSDKIKNIKRPSNFLAAMIFAEGYFKKLITV